MLSLYPKIGSEQISRRRMWIRLNPQPSMIGKCKIFCCVTHHVLVLVVLLVCHTVGVPAEAIPALEAAWRVQGAAVLTPSHLPLANPSLLAGRVPPGVGLLKAGAVTVAAAAAPELLLPGGGAPPLLAATRPPVVRPLLLGASPALAAILLQERPSGLAVGAATLQLLSSLG